MSDLPEDARSGLWRHKCGFVVISEDEPEETCERCDGFHEGWSESVLAERYPREGHVGPVTCSNCGETFFERNEEIISGWFCLNCGECIVPRTQRVRFDRLGDDEGPETEQTTLFDGGSE